MKIEWRLHGVRDSVLILGIISLSFFSLLDVSIPATNILEIFLLIIAISSVRKINLMPLWVALGSAFYIIFSYFYVLTTAGTNVFDFLLVYKVFYYIILLSLLVGKTFVDKQLVVYLVRLLILIFLAAYLSDLLRGSSRPSLLTENNFELMFLSLLLYLKYLLSGKLTISEIVATIAIFVIAGSRSASVILMVVFFAIYFERLSLRNFFIGIVLSLIVGYLAYNIFMSRLGGSGLEGIDRMVFFRTFLFETRDWGLLQFLFGAPRISELSANSCLALSYYERLFSFGDSTACYSVILHSYILRVIFDHGVIGLLLIIFVVFHYLRISGYSLRQVVVVLSVIMLNSLSVSAFNSIYAIIVLALYLVVDVSGVRGYLVESRSSLRS